jgi:hypothetical protein
MALNKLKESRLSAQYETHRIRTKQCKQSLSTSIVIKYPLADISLLKNVSDPANSTGSWNTLVDKLTLKPHKRSLIISLWTCTLPELNTEQQRIFL